MISTEARDRAAARWKEIMEKDFNIGYVEGMNEIRIIERQRLVNTRHINSVKSITNSTGHCSIGVNQLRRRRPF